MNWEEIYHRYILKYSNKIKQTTCSLDILGISFFGYHRIDIEGNYTVLTDRPDWAENYIENNRFSDDPFLSLPNKYSSGVCFYSASDNQQQFKKWKKQVQVDEGVILIEKDLVSVEFSFFGGSTENHNFSKTILNHAGMLRSFTSYFKQQCTSILMKQKEEGYCILKYGKIQTEIQPCLSTSTTESFLKSIGKDSLLKQFNVLSKREKDCLHELVSGKSIREIANKLMLSPRTVESYLENMKNKMQVDSKQELVGKAQLLRTLSLFQF